MSGEYTPLLANDPAVVVIFFNEPSSMELMTQTNRNQNNNEKQTSRDKQTDTKLIQDTRFNSDQKLNDIVELLNNFRQHPFMTLDSKRVEVLPVFIVDVLFDEPLSLAPTI